MTIKELIEMKEKLKQRVADTQKTYAENLECLENYAYRCSAISENFESSRERKYFETVEYSRKCFLTAVKDYEEFMSCDIIKTQKDGES